MKLDPVALKEVKHIAVGEFIGGAIACGVLLLLGKFSVNSLVFVLGGCLVAVGGFVWLCFSIQSVLHKDPDHIKGVMTKSYLGRMILYSAWVVVAVIFGADVFTKIAGALPILFPSFTIKIMNLINSSKKAEGEK